DASLINGVLGDLAGEGEALEAIREGSIKWVDFKVYLSSFGSAPTLLVLGLLMLAGALGEVAGNIWLSVWTAGSSEVGDHKGLAIYAALDVATGLVGCFQSLMLTLCSLAASRAIHAKMLDRLLRAPLSFFDSTPTGRLLNRFLQDMQSVDSMVPDRLSSQ
ncbi:unnamed protein product, partial [Polarella glacialis]